MAAQNPFDQVIRLIGDIIVGVLQATVDIACLVLMIFSLSVLPWRLFEELAWICREGFSARSWQNYSSKRNALRGAALQSFGFMVSDLFTIPFILIGLLSVVRVPFLLAAPFCFKRSYYETSPA